MKQYCSAEDLFLSTYNSARTISHRPPPPKTRLCYSPASPRICLYVYTRTNRTSGSINFLVNSISDPRYIYYIYPRALARVHTNYNNTPHALNRTSTDARSTVVSRLTLCRCCSSNIIMRSQTNVARVLVAVAVEDS